MKSKSLLLFSAFCILFNNLSAQGPTITGSPWWQAGDVFTNQWDSLGTLAIGGSGANQTWDFSSAADSGASYTVTVVSPSSTPTADSALFPGATLAAQYSFNNNYEYFTASGGNNYNDGGVTDTSHTVFTTAPLQLQLPMSYGDVYGGPIAGTYTSSTLSGTITGTDTTWADGYGTLIMPTVTYTNALRTHNNLVQNISVGGFSFNINYNAYDYMVPGYPFFIIEFAITSTTFAGHTTTVELISQAKNLPPANTGILLSTSDLDLSIYPNPAKDNIVIKISQDQVDQGATLEVTDLLGQPLMGLDLTSTVSSVNLSNIAKGAYIANVRTTTGIVSKKLVVD